MTIDNNIQLSEKQTLVLKLLSEGMNISEIASQMKVSRRMIDVHIHAIKKALNAKTREEAVAIGLTQHHIAGCKH